MLFASGSLAFLACLVLRALGQRTPIPLPKCNHVPTQLENKTYYQVDDDSDCTQLIGKPGTTIVNGLRINDIMSITGPMHFEGGVIDAGQWATFSGPNISFSNGHANFRLAPYVVNASVNFSNTTLSFGDTHTFGVMNSTVTFFNSNVTNMEEGKAEFASSNISFVNSSIEKVQFVYIEKSAIRFEGVGSGIHDSENSVDVKLVNSSMVFDQGDDAITESRHASDYSSTANVDVELTNSSLTFHNCTSIDRAVHGNGSLGRVTAASGSQVLCMNNDPGQFFV